MVLDFTSVDTQRAGQIEQSHCASPNADFIDGPVVCESGRCSAKHWKHKASDHFGYTELVNFIVVIRTGSERPQFADAAAKTLARGGASTSMQQSERGQVLVLALALSRDDISSVLR